MWQFISLENAFQQRLQTWLRRIARRLDQLEHALAWLVEGGWAGCPRCRPDSSHRIPVPAAFCLRCQERRSDR